MIEFIDEIREKLKTKDQLIGKDRYKIASILIPLIKIDNECHLLFQVRSENIPQGGEVCFPGGKFDIHKDKTTKDTAIRETIEELGIDDSNIKYIGKLGHYPAPMGILVDAYIALLNISDLQLLNYNKDEVERVFSVSISSMKNNPLQKYNVNIKVVPFIDENGERKITLPIKELGLPSKYQKPWGNIKHRVFVYKNDPVIWGITAEIVYDFLKLF